MIVEGFSNRRLRKAQRGRCYLCTGMLVERLPRGTPHRRQAMLVLKTSADHVIPRSVGASLARNKLLAHVGCNQQKGHRLPRPCELLYLEVKNEIAARTT